MSVFVLCRLVQYSAKLVAWLLEEDTAAVLAAQRAKTLESFLSLARKCMHHKTDLSSCEYLVKINIEVVCITRRLMYC